ncbi:uncharacterized protein [Vicugna pacos]|uniref:Uncharacterized protein n=1 Tax=Vicugna pacos TaxID=30538 RepID=A0ABM5CEL1_VICPA
MFPLCFGAMPQDPLPVKSSRFCTARSRLQGRCWGTCLWMRAAWPLMVTPVVSGFYTVRPQEGPLLLFSSQAVPEQAAGLDWTEPQTGFGQLLAESTRAWGAQPSGRAWSCPRARANADARLPATLGEKAELVHYEVRLQILGQAFTEALKDKTSPKSQELRGMLTRWARWRWGSKEQ